MHYIKKIFYILSKNNTVCILILLMIIILILGTLIQKDIDLYSAQKKYFTSYFILINNIIPFPGNRTIIFLLLVGLITKFLFNKIKYKKISTIIIHLSVLLFFLGGFILSSTSNEGFLVLEEQSEKKKFFIQNKYKLIIKNQTTFIKNSFNLKQNFKYTTNNITFRINKIYYNFDVEKKKPSKKKNYSDVTRYFNIIEKYGFLEKDKNIFAIILSINSDDFKIDQKLITYKSIPFQITLKDTTFLIKLSKFSEKLPFSIKLIKFQKINYLGTDLPKHYESLVVINDNNLIKTYTITMNKPLKYKKYTFYQSSFMEKNGENASVFIITKNQGQIFYYLACVFLILGFMIHFSKVIF